MYLESVTTKIPGLADDKAWSASRAFNVGKPINIYIYIYIYIISLL